MAKNRRGGGKGSVSYKLIKSEEDVFVSLDTFLYIKELMQKKKHKPRMYV